MRPFKTLRFCQWKTQKNMKHSANQIEKSSCFVLSNNFALVEPFVSMKMCLISICKQQSLSIRFKESSNQENINYLFCLYSYSIRFCWCVLPFNEESWATFSCFTVDPIKHHVHVLYHCYGGRGECQCFLDYLYSFTNFLF